MNINLSFVQSYTADEVQVAPTHYTLDGHIIPRSLVVAIVGKTFYYRNTVVAGEVTDVKEVKGQLVYITENGPVIVFDNSVATMSESVVAEAYEEEEEEAPKAKGRKAKAAVEEDEDDFDFDEEEEEAPKAKGRKAKAAVEEDEDEDDFDFDEEEEEEAPRKSKKAAPAKKGKKVVDEDEDEDFDDEEEEDEDDEDDEFGDFDL